MFSGFHDAGQQQRESYEDSDINTQLTDLWTTLAPFYRELHAYVRRRLVQRYGPERIRPDGPLPAHLLGKNLWNRDVFYYNTRNMSGKETMHIHKSEKNPVLPAKW